MKSLEKLMLTVGLLDRITGPLKGIQKTVDQVTRHSRKAFMNTAAGVTALIAASTTFASTINPANDMNMALGEVRSLGGVAEKTLSSLNQAGLKYSIQFGENAQGYVRSAYDIQSAIDGLAGNDLPRFTTAGGILAKATIANVSDITSYFGSMYGLFKNQAKEMGKGTWVEMLAGQTATAVQMFKTTGPAMAEAFKSLGAVDDRFGVGISEQMAVLGNLQSVYEGSEAGTKYSAFLQGLEGAQEKLGLKFTDQSGALLPVVEILEKIKKQTGGITDSLEFQGALKSAFGSDEAVDFVTFMSKDINKLNGDIANLSKQKGMEKAIWMAEQMQDPWARLASGIKAVSIAVWQKALPAINPFIDAMTQVSLVLVEWSDKYPHLTKAIGLGITFIMGFIAISGAFLAVLGMFKFASIGLTIALKMTGLGFIATKAKALLFAGGIKIARTAMWAFVLNGPAIAAFFATMKASFLTTLPAVWAFTSALLANPITWIVVGIAALIAALVAVVVYWDEVTEAINRFTDYVFEGLAAGWNWIKNLFAENAWLKLAFWPIFLAIEFVESLVASFDLISQWWGDFSVWFAGLTLFPNFNISTDLFEPLKAWWMDFKNWLSELDPFAFLGDSVDWMKDKLSWIPGIELDSTTEVKQKVESEQTNMNGLVTLPGNESTKAENEGGLFQTISNLFGGSSKSTHIEKIEVNNSGQPMRGDELAHEMEMQVG
ncbi:phage tail tape measure protein [Marinomonas sp. PE14-40]|uniref:phage tail tape measure protein n=1 Tax=Marinomonas sp. PE14-40 TaxID=3060621 RepID=UPI003F67E659